MIHTATPTLALALVATLALSLAACDDDDFAPSFSQRELLGTWSLWNDEMTYATEIVGVTTPVLEFHIAGPLSWTFNDDGTVRKTGREVRSITIYPGTDSAVHERDTFAINYVAEYRVAGDRIVITDGFYGKEGFFGEEDLAAPTTIEYSVEDFEALRLDLNGTYDFTVPFYGQEMRFYGTSTTVLTR